MRRDVLNDTELANATIHLIDGTEGRIERLNFADGQQEGICLSWWDNDRIMVRPLDGTEQEILLLFKNALHESLFSKHFVVALKQVLSAEKHGRDTIPSRLRNSPYATELERVSTNLADGSTARIERLRFKQNVYAGKEGIRFSWWKGNHMMPWPLSLTENELLILLQKALCTDAFSSNFKAALRETLESISL
jgi:hypothetical protein